MLELSYKYYYDDLYLALYSEDLDPFADLFGLPQLIYANTRLTLNRKSELQELNSLKIDRPLILLVNDRIDEVFTNPDIRVIYFCCDMNEVFRGSEVLVEYLDSTGHIYEDDIMTFSYEKPENNFKENAALLSPYQKMSFIDSEPAFSDVFTETDIRRYYQSKQTGLRADFAYIGKEILSFDLHESRQGPHGLIGGSTGSGKSELIVSMILSLCLRYRPDYLNLIIIDYKGGGIKESLSCRGQSLPHIIASVDNLEADTFERLILAIGSECRKRQRLFKDLSDRSMTSVVNIDDYLNGGYEEYGLPRLAHLLIVVDEFAELRKDDPEVIRELVSFSRIGRSLGLHLILATQRPSGVIDDEIWSNSHFKIALKVLSDRDSNDIIKTRDAAYLNDPGEFYLAVDDSLVRGKAIYSKRDHNNGDPYEVSLLDNRLDRIRRKSVRTGKTVSDAAYLTGKILDATEEMKIAVTELDFKRPKGSSREELKQKYGDRKGIILGEADDYLNARKTLLCFPDDQNIFICSSRPGELKGILNAMRRPCIVIASKRYRNSFITDSLSYDDGEDIEYLFDKLLREDRSLTLVIEDLSCLLSCSDEYASCIYQLLRRKTLSSMNMIALSAQSAISFKLLNCFRHKFIIEAYDDQDVLNVFSSRSPYSGKSFYFDEKPVSFIPCREEELREEESRFRPYIEHIPDSIGIRCFDDRILVGYSVKERKEVWLEKKEKLLIVSTDPDRIEQMRKLYAGQTNISLT
ncbi:MAG: hypothetical protein IKE38_00050, partial [Erysipelotrichaceae bacterium]|nr:hypothetical protein [Erysipelotrichaceae bacterium]